MLTLTWGYMLSGQGTKGALDEPDSWWLVLLSSFLEGEDYRKEVKPSHATQSVEPVEALPTVWKGKFLSPGQGLWGGVRDSGAGVCSPAMRKLCALVPLSPGPILRTSNVSTDALTANVRVKDRWVAGVLVGREKSGGRKSKEEAEGGVREASFSSVGATRCVLCGRQQTCRDRISLWAAGSRGSLGRLGCGYSSGSRRLQEAWASHPCSNSHLMSERQWGKEPPSGKQAVCRGGCQRKAPLLREPPGKSRDEVTPPLQQA